MMRGRPIHPILFGAFPVVFLWAQNYGEGVGVADVALPLALTTAAAAASFGILRLILRDPARAAFLTTGLLALFFSFGHLRNRVDPYLTGSVDGTLFGMYLALFVVLVWATFRLPSLVRSMTTPLNLSAVILIALNLGTIVVRSASARDLTPMPCPSTGLHIVGEPRDVYYLVFDRYANPRVLREQYGFDDSPFLEALEARGFYVAEDSAANHLKTIESLASSLNMDYLHGVAETQGADSRDAGALSELLRHHCVGRFFKRLGYEYHHVGSWWGPTKANPMADVNVTWVGLPEFSMALYETTPLPAIAGPALPRIQYDHVRMQFARVASIARLSQPTFTFAHFLVPHDPYVFDPDGRYVSPDEAARRPSDENYLRQLLYTNRQIEELVDALLGAPGPEPIIVIQSDEGPFPSRFTANQEEFQWREATTAEVEKKMLILNAYHLPGVGHAPLYPSISPVNTFRLIFDLYFGGELPLLPDRSFAFQDWNHPYVFIDVTDRLRKPASV